MLNLSERPDHGATKQAAPLTAEDWWQLLVFVVVFFLWLPTYLVFVRPALNALIFRVLSSYPAMVHLVPIFAVPYVALLLYKRIGSSKR